MTGGGSPAPRGEPLLLCSASPRRVELLRAAGIPFERGVAPDVDESPPLGADPETAVVSIAVRKARASATRAPGRIVLCADTVVACDGAILGKPIDRDDAVRMLFRLSGRAHEVWTAVAIARGAEVHAGADVATVEFRALTDAEVRAYVGTGEPMDKAGAYAIQGGAAPFVTRLVGERDTVVGLTLHRVRSLLRRFAAGASNADGEESGASPPA